jgi:RimJ/RimL family protein N-acetyltransferase
MTTVETPRLRLRPMQESDAEPFLEIHQDPEGWPGLELGWVIRRSCRGNGFATEAARAALQWTWDHVDTDHIISIIQPDNARSIRVAEKIGERFERAHVMSETDVHIYGVGRPRMSGRV